MAHENEFKNHLQIKVHWQKSAYYYYSNLEHSCKISIKISDCEIAGKFFMFFLFVGFKTYQPYFSTKLHKTLRILSKFLHDLNFIT